MIRADRLARRVSADHAVLVFPQTADSLYELAFRESDGIEVALLWNGVFEDRVLLSVRDRRTREWCVCGVDGADALEAYRHPFAYIARRDGYAGLLSAAGSP
jgi:hypothetical protein